MEHGVRIDPARIRSLREARFWSQDHLAAVCGVSLRTIQRVEADGSSSADTRMALAAAFGLDGAALIAPHATVAAVPPPANATLCRILVGAILRMLGLALLAGALASAAAMDNDPQRAASLSLVLRMSAERMHAFIAGACAFGALCAAAGFLMLIRSRLAVGACIATALAVGAASVAGTFAGLTRVGFSDAVVLLALVLVCAAGARCASRTHARAAGAA